MNRLLIAISMVLVLGGLAQAGSSRGASFQGYSSGPIWPGGNYVINARGSVIYNITLNAGQANAIALIYDSSTGGTMLENPIYEIEVASAGDSRSVDMNAAPLQSYNGVVVSVTNGIAFLNMEK